MSLDNTLVTQSYSEINLGSAGVMPFMWYAGLKFSSIALCYVTETREIAVVWRVFSGDGF